MLTLKQNETAMQYAKYLGSAPIYSTEPDGSIKYYTDTEGNRYPMDTGEYMDTYGNVSEFFANISLSSDMADATEYGLSNADFSAVLVLQKGHNIQKGDYVWVYSPVQYAYKGEEVEVQTKDGETVTTRIAKVESADYQVVGIPDSMNVGKVLLKSVNK